MSTKTNATGRVLTGRCEAEPSPWFEITDDLPQSEEY